tara:strand:+ start:417 stop:554 length:138 start_codon:yes stop_codon:yes gene_type:complete
MTAQASIDAHPGLMAEANKERAEIITTFYTITSKLESPPLQTVRK